MGYSSEKDKTFILNSHVIFLQRPYHFNYSESLNQNDALALYLCSTLNLFFSTDHLSVYTVCDSFEFGLSEKGEEFEECEISEEEKDRGSALGEEDTINLCCN